MARKANKINRIVDIIYDNLPKDSGGGEGKIDTENLKMILPDGRQLEKQENGTFSNESKVVIAGDTLYATDEPIISLEDMISQEIIYIEVIPDEV